MRMKIVISLKNLNQHMDWSMDYFKKLRASLEEQKKEVVYSFSAVDDQEDENRIFKITFKIAKGADIVGLTVKCAFISTTKVLENLMKEMTFINMSKKRATKDLEKKIENLETEKMVILENMNDVAQAKEQLENDLLNKFTLILNEKKKKIAGLNQELEIIKSTIKPGTKIAGVGVITKSGGNNIINTDGVDTKIEEEFPTQPTQYHLDVSGSQHDWVRKPRPKDRKEDPESINSTIMEPTTKVENTGDERYYHYGNGDSSNSNSNSNSFVHPRKKENVSRDDSLIDLFK